jgi:hypothetical protein
VSSVLSCRNGVTLSDGIRGSFSDDQKSLRTTEIGSSFPSNSSSMCPYPKYSRVFIMAQYDDTQIGQFMQESLPRLTYHLDFLLANPDIKIQFGFTKKAAPPKNVLPHAYIKFLGTNIHDFFVCNFQLNSGVLSLIVTDFLNVTVYFQRRLACNLFPLRLYTL